MNISNFKKIMIPKFYLLLDKVSNNYKIEIDSKKENITIVYKGNKKKDIDSYTKIIDFDGNDILFVSDNYSCCKVYKKDKTLLEINQNYYSRNTYIRTIIRDCIAKETITIDGKIVSKREYKL